MIRADWRGRLAAGLFRHRALVLALFLIATLGFAATLFRLHIDAGFDKLLPLQHPYMQTFVEHREAFGGANRVLVAVMARDGDIFTPEYFATLRQATDAVFFLPGVDRSRVRSLFTPNVRYTEVVEDGIAGDNVVPADFLPTPEGLAEVRQNILNAGIVGRMAAWLSGVPVLIHTFHGFGFNREQKWWTYWFFIWCERLCGRWTRALIFVSESNRKTAEELKIAFA